MLEKNTRRVLNKMGAAYVKEAKFQIRKVRTVRSKITGDRYKKRINTTGKLARSFEYDVSTDPAKDKLELDIQALPYAVDVSTGNPRPANAGKLSTWIKNKGIRIEASDGTLKAMTRKQTINFANFLAWKIRHIGSDFTGYLDGIAEKVEERFDEELEQAVTDDIAENLAEALNNMDNITAQET